MKELFSKIFAWCGPSKRGGKKPPTSGAFRPSPLSGEEGGEAFDFLVLRFDLREEGLNSRFQLLALGSIPARAVSIGEVVGRAIGLAVRRQVGVAEGGGEEEEVHNIYYYDHSLKNCENYFYYFYERYLSLCFVGTARP